MSFDLKIENGAIIIDTSGDFTKVEKSEKLVQDIFKIINTPLGASKFNPWYGSPVGNIIGNVLDQNFAATMASNQLQNALQTLKTMQEIQSRTQFLSPEEQLAAVRQATIKQNMLDPRVMQIVVSVVNKAFQQINRTQDVPL